MIPVLFIFPPSRSDYRFRFHLGVGYIQAYLEGKRVSSSQYFPQKRVTLPNIVDNILRHKPEIVGFTCYDSNYYIIKSISRLLKKRKPDLPIVIGGPTATFSDQFILKDCQDLDVCVRSEGEETTYELVKADLTDLRSIRGITFREGNSIVRVGDRPLVRGEKKGAELDVLPSPYLREIAPPDGQAGVLTSRGCVYKCTFCNFSAMSMQTVRYHSVDRVVEELHRINEYINNNSAEPQKPLVQFNDDTFSLNTERAKEMCRRIIDEKINLKFYADTRADFCDAELLKLMHEAGFAEINFGLESAVPRVLRNVKKIYSAKRNDFSPEEQFLQILKDNVRLAKELGFHTSVSVILGLPGETVEDAMKTLRFVKELGVNEYSHNFLKIHSGTELSETYSNYDLDITESATILPYQTIYPFDVYALEPLQNASLQTSAIEDETTYVELIANNFGQFEGKNWLNLIINDINEQDAVISWLVNVASLPFSLYLRNMDYGLTYEHAARYIGKLVRRGVHIGNFYFVKKAPPCKQGTKAYKLMRFGESFWPRSLFVEIPFSKYQNRDLLPETIKTIFTITNKDDVEALTHLAKRSIGSELMNMEQPYPTSCIEEECRWAIEQCPAANFHRLIIRPDSSIVSCLDGDVIGYLNSSYEEMEAALKYMWEKELSRRNCDACPIEDHCSKCLFPYPLTAQEYCDLRRAHPKIGDFINLLRTARMLLRDGGPLSEKNVQRVSMHIEHKTVEKSFRTQVKKEIKLVYANRSPYVVNVKTQKIFRLNEFTAHVLRAVICGVGSKDLAESLHKNYSEEKGEVVNLVQEALKAFKEKGFLESDDG